MEELYHKDTELQEKDTELTAIQVQLCHLQVCHETCKAVYRLLQGVDEDKSVELPYQETSE